MQGSKVLTVRFEKRLEMAIARIARADGMTKGDVVRAAVVRYLEDREDVALAEQAKNEGGRAKSIVEVRKSLDLDQ